MDENNAMRPVQMLFPAYNAWSFCRQIVNRDPAREVGCRKRSHEPEM